MHNMTIPKKNPQVNDEERETGGGGEGGLRRGRKLGERKREENKRGQEGVRQ